MISIEPATLAHAPALQTLFEDRDVTEHLAFPEPYPPGEMARYITTAIAGRQAGTRYVFAVIEPDGQPSGIALLKDVDARAGTGELGYAFGRAYWGGGRATAAADATAAFAFETLKLKTLRAVCGAMNLASLRVLAKLGFVEESRFDEVRTKWPEPRQQIVLRVRSFGYVPQMRPVTLTLGFDPSKLPPGVPLSAMRVLLTDPAGDTHDKSIWGKGTVDETVSFP